MKKVNVAREFDAIFKELPEISIKYWEKLKILMRKFLGVVTIKFPSELFIAKFIDQHQFSSVVDDENLRI